MAVAVRSRPVLAMQKVEGSSPFIRLGSMPFPGLSRLRAVPMVSQSAHPIASSRARIASCAVSISVP